MNTDRFVKGCVNTATYDILMYIAILFAFFLSSVPFQGRVSGGGNRNLRVRKERDTKEKGGRNKQKEK